MAAENNINRRKFLKSAAGTLAGVVAFPYIVGSSALGKAGTIAASNRIVIGCIGVGGQGINNMFSFIGEADTRVVAVCDVDAGHRKKARNLVNAYYRNRDCVVFADFRDLLARDDIDAVVVCTPDHWHGLICVAAAEAGKDIYCEKPLVNTIVEGRALADAVGRYGRVLQTGSHERSTASARFACELVRNGRIGKLHTIRVNLPIANSPIGTQPTMPIPDGFDYNMWLGPTPWVPYTKKRCHFNWRWILDYGGGEMTDRGAHVIALAQLGHGTDDTGPVEIIARGRAPGKGLFNTFVAYEFECRYADGVRMVGQSGGVRGVKFEGTEGWIFIHVHGGHLEAQPKSVLRESIGPNEISLGRSPGHRRNFLDAVKSRRQPVAPVEAGHRTASICHLINIAMLTEQKLTWDPGLEQMISGSEPGRMLARPMRSPWHL